jgi:hypothetical protein
MKPGEKIETIKSVAAKLANIEDWGEIDLILRTFGFPTSDQWSSDGKYGYLMVHLEDGEEKQLKAIREYALGEKENDEEPDISELTGPWVPQRFKLFVSHITKDKVFASEVKSILAERGIDCFIAHEDIKPTKEWVEEIIKALDTCDALAAFITPQYHESLWTDQEVGYCMRRRVLVIPVGLGATPYGFMGRYQGAQCKGKSPAEVAETIFDILASNLRAKTRLFEGLMGSFEESTSFDIAAARARLLQKIDIWSPELLRRLQAAQENNSQISESFVANPIVEKILSDNTF